MAETVIRYSNDGLSLENVPAIKEITIKAKATSIKGIGSGAYAFLNAKDTICRVSFETGSQMSSIPPFCFYFCKYLSSVDFSQCTKIVSIGEKAFSNCESLATLTLPTTVKTIDSYVFQYSGLVSIKIPSSVETFGVYNFFRCNNLVSFEIDPNCPMTTLSNHQFTATKLVSLKLTKSIQEFSGDNFEHVSTISKLEVDPGNQHLVSHDNVIFTFDMTKLLYAAPSKTGLYEVPFGVDTISNCAFFLSSITDITFPMTLKTINGWSFIESKITSLHFSSNFSFIGTRAFYNCSDLQSVTFEEGINTIGESCFASCEKLTSVSLPKSLVNLCGGAFPLTVDITLNPDGNLKKTDNNQFIINSGGTFLSCCISSASELTIPYTITTISSEIFYGLQTIKKLIIPSNSQLCHIQSYAFKESSIEEINLPETVQSIEPEAFCSCTHLKSIHLGRSIATISYSAFLDCTELAAMTVSDGQDITIGPNAFNGCSNLTCDSFKGRLSDIGDDCFRGCSKLSTVGFSERIVKIGNNAFQETGLTTVTFPQRIALTTLPVRCFYKCTELTTCSIPEGIEIIMNEALAYTSIASVTLPLSVTHLNEGCFQYCSKLKTFTIPEGSLLTEIGFGVFYNCLSFESISNQCDKFTIENEALFNKEKTELYILPPESKCKYFSFPVTLQRIGISALQGCHNIEVIFLHSNVTEIMPYAFSECTNLRSINIPIQCNKIGNEAFNDCKKMQCGIPIENKDPEFRQSLVTDCGLPLSAISDCILECPTLYRTHGFNAYIMLLSFSLFIVV